MCYNQQFTQWKVQKGAVALLHQELRTSPTGPVKVSTPLCTQVKALYASRPQVNKAEHYRMGTKAVNKMTETRWELCIDHELLDVELLGAPDLSLDRRSEGLIVLGGTDMHEHWPLMAGPSPACRGSPGPTCLSSCVSGGRTAGLQLRKLPWQELCPETAQTPLRVWLAQV